ncbi:hypothetical protein BGZ97_009569 [Linnemannia gamsii]|uniref:Uncharacterized protein n=1 Tax=Linnemannia gamsii TaxID=64522 RepID=A0A9P6UPX5_9FUNG|nr:hypothetical protein BGZ97_009569 [Linnemannia gamsii]
MLPYGDSAPTKDITISGIGVSTTITLGGLDGFKALEVVGGSGSALTLNLNFKNPSPELTMRFGDVTFQAVDSAGITVGTILLPDWTVRPGADNPVTAVLTGDDGLSEIVSTFGDYGRHGSSKNLGVVGALAGVKIDLAIPADHEA